MTSHSRNFVDIIVEVQRLKNDGYGYVTDADEWRKFLTSLRGKQVVMRFMKVKSWKRNAIYEYYGCRYLSVNV